MARAVGRRSFGVRRQHQFAWDRGDFISTTLAAASTKALVVLFIPGSGLDITIERIYTTTLLRSDQAAGSENQLVAFGAIVVSMDAFTAGAASVPGPISDGDADWMMHGFMPNRFNFRDGTGSDSIGGAVFQNDSKARRRVADGHGLAFVLETGAASSGLVVAQGITALARMRGT